MSGHVEFEAFDSRVSVGGGPLTDFVENVRLSLSRHVCAKCSGKFGWLRRGSVCVGNWHEG